MGRESCITLLRFALDELEAGNIRCVATMDSDGGIILRLYSVEADVEPEPVVVGRGGVPMVDGHDAGDVRRPRAAAAAFCGRRARGVQARSV